MSKTEKAHAAYAHGTDAQFLEWVSYQPSVIDGAFNPGTDNEGIRRNIPCHVRRLKFGAGMGFKPPFSAIPMTDAQHKVQSSGEGEAGVLRRFRNLTLTGEQAKHWFERVAEDVLSEWIYYQQSKGN